MGSMFDMEELMKKIPDLPKIRTENRLFYSPESNEKNKYREINKEIKKKYNINLVSRDTIIKNIITILTQGSQNNSKLADLNISIIRTDISNFYNSIDKHLLYKKISHSNILAKESLETLKPLFFSNSVKGVPLGLPFSGSLSEIYLEDFDRDITVFFDPIFYFRYVDDIIIILNNNSYTGEEKENFKQNSIKKLDNIFSSYSLKRNDEKTIFTYYNKKNRNLEFEYLGYHFKSSTNNLSIDISDSKTDKIIRQIKHSFGVFKQGNHSSVNFWKLYYRLQHTIYDVTSTNEISQELHFGLAYSYKFINSSRQLNKIINQTKYYIFSCKLSSYKQFMLLQLISYENSILEKKYNYNKITKKQFKLIKKRLNIVYKDASIEHIFYVIHNNKFK